MKLFEPIKVGNHALKNRMVMAPMTRSRANLEGIVGDATVLYYTQRVRACSEIKSLITSDLLLIVT